MHISSLRKRVRQVLHIIPCFETCYDPVLVDSPLIYYVKGKTSSASHLLGKGWNKFNINKIRVKKVQHLMYDPVLLDNYVWIWWNIIFLPLLQLNFLVNDSKLLSASCTNLDAYPWPFPRMLQSLIWCSPNPRSSSLLEKGCRYHLTFSDCDSKTIYKNLSQETIFTKLKQRQRRAFMPKRRCFSYPLKTY